MDIKLIERTLALGNLVKKAGMAYVEADTGLCITSWNREAQTLFGPEEEAALGRPLADIVPVGPDRLNACNRSEMMSAAFTGRQGTEILCDIFYTPIKDLKGRIKGFSLLARDVTAQARNRQRLRKLEDQVEAIYGFAPIGIFHVDIAGAVTTANSEYAWMLGYESAAMVTDQINDFAGQVFFDPEKAEEFMFALFEAEQIIRFRCRLKRRDHSFIWALSYAKATYDDTGRINGFNGYSIDISETIRAEQALQAANDKLTALSVMDGLTRIPNRRRFDECLEAEWERHNREQGQLSIILCDIDYFKKFNDTYGHQAGDECLKQVARAIHGCACRASDLAARYGGEEFAVILPNTDTAGAMVIAERIRSAVQALEVEHRASDVSPHVSLSLGVGTLVPDPDTSKEILLENADKALYAAKENGRNQCMECVGDAETARD